MGYIQEDRTIMKLYQHLNSLLIIVDSELSQCEVIEEVKINRK